MLAKVNDIDDDTHARLDQIVLQAVGRKPSSALSLAILLLVIVSKSEGRLDPTFKDLDNAEAFLQQYPNLTPELRVAWKAKSFREIRSLSTLSLAF
jgi:hypothetical protein